MVCSYHTMHTHVEQLDIHFRENVGTDNSNLPLLPDKDGNALTNAEVVEAIRLVLTKRQGSNSSRRIQMAGMSTASTSTA